MSVFACPLCSGLLTLKDKSWCCEKGHSYDLAKEGYVNLLLAQQKNSKQPGDNKQMVAGRRAFLEQGHYQPLANELGKLFSENLSGSCQPEPIRIFDAGCGEGYYIDHVSQYIKTQHPEAECSGIDISKFAIQKAAKKYRQHKFAVASTFHIPLASDSRSGVLQIFAPSSEAEIHRILRVNGCWINVTPAANHLYEIKQALYDSPTEHQEKPVAPKGFTLKHQQRLGFTLNLTEPSQRENLLMMTPYYWSASEQKKQKLIGTLVEVTADFDIKVWVKH